MKKINLLLSFFALALWVSCSNQANESEAEKENATETQEETTKAAEEEVEIEGYDTIEELSKSVVESLKARDYDTYYSHVMTEEMELEQAAMIKDSAVRKEFLHEYGFSLHEEKVYFDNLLHFYDTKNIDLDQAILADMEYAEYKGGEYHPLELYEVFIPIKKDDYEMLIDFTVIKVDDKYYLTSELGI